MHAQESRRTMLRRIREEMIEEVSRFLSKNLHNPAAAYPRLAEQPDNRARLMSAVSDARRPK